MPFNIRKRLYFTLAVCLCIAYYSYKGQPLISYKAIKKDISNGNALCSSRSEA